MSKPPSRQRALPSVDSLLVRSRATRLPRPLVVAEARNLLQRWRTDSAPIPPSDELENQLRDRLASLERTRLQRVLNGTGILAHTNLGRAPLSTAASEALREIAHGYCNLELDLDSGERGSRGAYLDRVLATLCGAEAATVVNNGAAALVLALRALVRPDRSEVVISRGELVQIGGGFRIPEILETAGASLREVGTTNQTSLRDYESALSTATALVLRVHRSNFHMDGFVHSPATAELARLAHAHHVPLVDDLGSGALANLESLHPHLHHEPTPDESLRAGADLVCFSGDKLLGGPQAGIVVGRADLILELRHHPLFRALRCDKLVFAALQATAEAQLAGAAQQGEPPLTGLLRLSLESLNHRAHLLVESLRASCANLAIERVETLAEVGGGVCPRSSLPSVALSLRPSLESLEDFARKLRQGAPPVVGYLHEGSLRLDLRTILADQDPDLLQAIRSATIPS